MSKKHLVIRVDASPFIGLGHVTRQCDLAQRLIEKGWRVTMLVRAPVETRDVITQRCSATLRFLDPDDETDFSSLPPLLKQEQPDGIMIDLLHRDNDPAYMQLFRQPGAPIISVTDDPYPRQVNCDIQICCNPNQTESLYRFEVDALPRRYLGVSYAMIHPLFADARSRRQYRTSGYQIVVQFGGVHHPEALDKIFKALELCLVKANVTIVSSLAADRYLGKQQSLPSGISVIFRASLTPAQICEEMVNADMMLGSCGNAAYEACILGLPLVTVNQVNRQNENAAALAAQGVCINLGMLADIPPQAIALAMKSVLNDAQQREKIGKKAMTLFDGHGLSRVCDIITGAVS